MNKTFKLIESIDPKKGTSNILNKTDKTCIVSAPTADKAALLFMSQIFKNNRKGKVVRVLKILNLDTSRTFIRTVSRLREETVPINGQRFRYVHQIIVKQT